MTAGRVMHGEYGTATEVLFTPSIPDQQASIRTWLLDCPGQSPFWSHYMLSIIHLREIDGARPVTILFPVVTHQVMVGWRWTRRQSDSRQHRGVGVAHSSQCAGATGASE